MTCIIKYFKKAIPHTILNTLKIQDKNLLNTYFRDIAKMKDGMSDKVAMAVQWITAFFAGFIIAFAYEWRLALVIMSTSPLLAIGGFMFSKVLQHSNHKLIIGIIEFFSEFS